MTTLAFLFRCLLFLLLFSGWAGSSQAVVGKDPYTHFFNESWGQFPEELEKARAEGKTAILLFFELDECPFCRRMKTTVLNQPEVQAYFREHFLNFAIDIEGEVEMTDFKGTITTQRIFSEKDNRVRATPVFAFYDLQGDRIVRYTGATSGIKEFLWLGEFVAQGIYKDMSFTRYKRQKANQASQDVIPAR
ncbi:MAG: thioredoxin family protein [Ectothiorhodospiraceae bacterium]|nr:thioredoxin family protein [Ectothiorhodospiraceae bacterium]